MTEPRQAPVMRDSDVIYLAIKRLEAVADKMQRLEYDDKLTTMLEESAELFDWILQEIAQRAPSDDEAAE